MEGSIILPGESGITLNWKNTEMIQAKEKNPKLLFFQLGYF